MRELNSINLIWIILTPRISRSVAVASKAHGIGVLFAIFV
jgi:carbamoylphosphate synthase large subunit